MNWSRLLWIGLVVALCTACNVSPLPLPLPYSEGGVATDRGTIPGKDGGVDMPTPPDSGMIKDSAVQDSPGPMPDLVGTPDSAPSDGGAPIEDGGAPIEDGGPTTDGGGPTTDGGGPTTDGVGPTTDGVGPTTDGVPIIEGGPTEGGVEMGVTKSG